MDPSNSTITRTRAGFTLRELVVVLLIIVALLAVIVVTFTRQRREQMVAQDAAQLTTIMQAMAVCNLGPDTYPRPSSLEPSESGPTLAIPAEEKNTTGNIFSIMVNDGCITPEHLVSPLENNASIRPYTQYRYDNPATAAIPTQAQWDPALSGDFTRPEGGHISYAHIPPVGKRRAMWSCTFSSTEPAMGSRGPEVLTVTRDAGGAATSYSMKNPASNTLRMHGPPQTWEGHMAYNDGQVKLETSVTPLGMMYRRQDMDKVPDVLFFNEPDDRDGINVYLGIWIKAGPTVEDYRGAWD